MIVYNVTIKVETDSAVEWVEWMKTTHMPDVMALDIFKRCRLSRLLEQDEADGLTYSAQYECASLDDYNTYINEHSNEMRERSLKMFAGKFVAFRSVMEVIG